MILGGLPRVGSASLGVEYHRRLWCGIFQATEHDVQYKHVLQFSILTVVGPLLVACGSASQANKSAGELEWARAALARNPSLELVAVDDKARVFTVRMKASGALQTLRLEEMTAGPAASFGAPPGASPDVTPSAATSSAAQPGEAATPAVADTANGKEADPALAARGAYSIERSSNGVKISGRGLSIASSGAAPVAKDTQSAAPDSGLERRSEPMRCQGSNQIHIDNQKLAFSGDGIIAEQGCEVFITNSHIEALGNALLVDASKIHVTNSMITGGTGSLQLRNRGQAYVGSSTLSGMSRRFDTSQLHDLGGNRWN